MFAREPGENIRFFSQNDPLCKNEIMTEAKPNQDPLKRRWLDTIGQYGCLVSCLSNFIQLLINIKYTPKDLNDQLKTNQGYQYLRDPLTAEKGASIINWAAVKALFQSIDFNLHVKKFYHESNALYIGELKDRVHFVNIINVKLGYNDHLNFICYDVWDGQTKVLDKEDFDYFHILTLKGETK